MEIPVPLKTAADDVAELLPTIHGFRLPAVVLVDLRRTQQQHAEADAEWQRYDSGNPRAVLRQPQLAQVLLTLGKQEKRLTTAYDDARHRLAAFVQLVTHFKAVGADRARRIRALLDHPPNDETTRLCALRELDAVDRLYSRLAWSLATVSNARLFREPEAAVILLRRELEVRLGELEQLRIPGNIGRFVTPPEIASLMSIVNGCPEKETA